MSNNFRENLKDELEYQNITIKELSLKTEISNRSIENYLSKRESIPPADYAVKIAKALGVTVEYLVTGRNPDCTTKTNRLYDTPISSHTPQPTNSPQIGGQSANEYLSIASPSDYYLQ